MYRATIEIADSFGVRIKGLKLHLKCKKCGRLWAIWFEDEKDLFMNLPEDWFICLGCQKET